MKIHEIRGVGRFKDFRPSPPIELGNINLIYARNGKGKSTLAEVFRTLGGDEEPRIVGRKTIGDAAQQQHVVISAKGKLREFHNGHFKKKGDDMLVFDEVFINDNVYQGLEVTVHHKRNLHPLIIGDAAVKGVERENQLREEIKDLQKQLGQAQTKIEKQVFRLAPVQHDDFNIEEFVQEPRDTREKLDQQIEAQNSFLTEIRQQDQYRNASRFQPISFPALPLSALQALLVKSIGELAHDARVAVNDHMSQFTGQNMESWIREGRRFQHSGDEICPYCGQQLRDTRLLDHYQALFQKKYTDFEAEVGAFDEHKRIDRAISELQQSMAANESISTFWAEYTDGVVLPDLSVDQVRLALDAAVKEIDRQLAAKLNALFKPLNVSEVLKEISSSWEAFGDSATRYNASVDNLNRRIDKKLAEAEVGQLEIESSRLLLLRIRGLRLNSDVNIDCKNYLRLGKQLEQKQSEFEQAKEETKRLTKQAFEIFGERINKYLGKLGAGFEINELEENRKGGRVRAEYMLELVNAVDTPVALGSADSIHEEPGFGNILSEGDRRSLALAFFLSRLDRIDDLSQAVLVFDDPVTSMDVNRSSITCELIAGLASRGAQVIVLTHRLEFARSFLRQAGGQGSVTLLEIRPVPNDLQFSEIVPDWDIHAAARSYFEQEILDLIDFVEGRSHKNAIDIAKKPRPLIEEYYATRYPHEFGSHEDRIGVFINCVKQAQSGGRRYELKISSQFTELQRLYSYFCQFHHKNPPTPDVDELIKYCDDALKHIGRI